MKGSRLATLSRTVKGATLARTVKGAALARTIMLTVLVLISQVALASTKVDPLINIMANRPAHAVKAMKAFGAKSVTGVAQTDAFIKVKDVSAARGLIEGYGGRVRSIVGDIFAATIPLNAVSAIAESDDIIYIEAAKPVQKKMDAARGFTGVAGVQDGNGTGGTAYIGSGVIVGVADSGIDCEHADFKDGSGNPRIVAYWDQSIEGTGVAEITGSEGVEYTGTDLADGGACANSYDTSDIGHGTHVAGIAAGSNATFKGVAPDANIIAVLLSEPSIASGYTTYSSTLSTNVTDAVDYIFRKAHTLQKPAVVNLSIGTSLGAHDGTSLFEETLDGLLIESGTTEKDGRAIVNAAGNENAAIVQSAYAGGIHATIDVSTNSPEAFEFVSFSGASIDPVGDLGGVWVDIWLSSSSSCTIAVNAYNAAKTSLAKQMTAVAAGSSNQTAPVGDGTVEMYVDFSDSANALNGKKHAIANVTADTSGHLDDYSFDLVFDGTCAGDAWLYYDNVNYNYFTKDRISPAYNTALGYSYIDGDSDSTMTIPATASRVISVGSYMGRDTYTDMNGVSRNHTGTYGTEFDLSTFSSLGPTADGRVKPDIVAPGEPIISTMSSTLSVAEMYKGDATHYKQQGTSMASPHVAGTVALMLQKNGCLKPAQIKDYITTNADSDVYTGSSLPDSSWGYGKLNAAAAVNNITAASCTPSNASEEGASSGDSGDDDEPADAATAAAGCGSISGAKYNNASVFVAFMMIFSVLSVLHGASSYKKSRSK